MACAEQFVLFDVMFTFTKADADNSKPSKSHYYVTEDKLNPNRPRNWTAPVDYRNGTVHIRAEVLEKPPGGAPTTWSLCYIPNKGQGNGYGCTGTAIYREKGVYERDVPMRSFWQNDAIVWSAGIKRMDLVIKDDSGGAGHAHKRKDFIRFFPTKMRITMVQVSAGSKYDPSLVPNLPPPAGGDEEKAKEGAATNGAACCETCALIERKQAPGDRRTLSPTTRRRFGKGAHASVPTSLLTDVRIETVLLAEGLRDNIDDHRAHETSAAKEVNQRISGRREQERHLYESLHHIHRDWRAYDRSTSFYSKQARPAA